MHELAGMDLIKAWLNGNRNYLTGVKLYLQHGDDDLLKKLFTAEKETSYKRQQLEEELKAICNKVNGDPPGDHTVDEVPAKSITTKSWPYESCRDEVEKTLRANWLIKFKEMQDLRSQLLLLGDMDARCEAAFRILRLDRESDDYYFQRDYYRKYGKLPDQHITPYVQDPLVMGVRIQSLKRYIRREGEKLKNDPANHIVASRRNEFIKELNFYLNKLGKSSYEETNR
jgi:hypothetical protein